MSTLSVTVEGTNHALMLAEWLQSIRFVKKVEIETPSRGNVEIVQKALDAIQAKKIFSDITDPVDYQKKLRDEWD